MASSQSNRGKNATFDRCSTIQDQKDNLNKIIYPICEEDDAQRLISLSLSLILCLSQCMFITKTCRSNSSVNL